MGGSILYVKVNEKSINCTNCCKMRVFVEEIKIKQKKAKMQNTLKI